MESEKWDGSDRRAHGERRKGHRMTSRLLVIWIVVFSIAVGYAVQENRDTTNETTRLVKENAKRISDINRNKAALKSLKKTNCGLELFLLTARKARFDSYVRFHDSADLEAVRGYEHLIAPFKNSTGNCPIPHKLLIPNRPVRGIDSRK